MNKDARKMFVIIDYKDTEFPIFKKESALIN